MYRTAFVIEVPARHKNLDGLKTLAENVEFLSSGSDHVSISYENLIAELLTYEFDPDIDIIIPIARLSVAVILGIILGKNYSNRSISIAIYANGGYTSIQVP